MACCGLHLGGGNDSFRLRGTRIVRTPKRTWFSSKGFGVRSSRNLTVFDLHSRAESEASSGRTPRRMTEREDQKNEESSQAIARERIHEARRFGAVSLDLYGLDLTH